MTLIGKIKIFLLLHATFGSCKGIVNINPDQKEVIDNFINNLLFDCEEHDVVGMNLAVVFDGEVLYTTGYGLRNLDTREPVTENTVYHIASTGKQFTTTLVGQLLKNTGYNWDTKVGDLMSDLGKEFYLYDPLRTNLTTLRDLASHSTGFFGSDYIWFAQDMSREELVNRLRFIPPVRELRTIFLYNNLMYVLLGYVGETLAGIPFEQMVQTEIFDKVGMANSSFIYEVDEDSVELATPYLLAPIELRPLEWEVISDAGPDMAPGGAITSTANDMARWMNVLLSGGLNEAGERVFDEDVVLEIQSPVNAHSYNPDNLYKRPNVPVTYEAWNSYGLGIGQGTYRGYRTLMHPGVIYGHNTRYHLLPDASLGIYTSVNGIEGEFSAMDQIAMFIADVVLGKEPWLNATTACSFPEPFYNTKKSQNTEQKHNHLNFAVGDSSDHKAASKPVLKQKVDQYIGQYGNFAYGNMSVEVDDVNEEIRIVFDAFSCTVRYVTNQTLCFGDGDYWFTLLDGVIFDEVNNPSQFVDVLFTPFENYVRFERDLSLEDAPGPTDHWSQCEL